MKKHAANVAVSILLLIAAPIMTGCTPGHDWREVHGSAAPFSVLLPAKPAILSRPIDLAGTALTMTMTAAEIDGVTYAVGSVDLPDNAGAQAAIIAMKTALVRNMRGKIRAEKSIAVAETKGAALAATNTIEIEAVGSTANAMSRLLVARFVAHNNHAYQIVVSGPEKVVSREQVETFMMSFKPE